MIECRNCGKSSDFKELIGTPEGTFCSESCLGDWKANLSERTGLANRAACAIGNSRLVTVVIGRAIFNYSVVCGCGNYFQVVVPKSKKRFKPKCPKCGRKTVSMMGNQTRMKIQ